MPRERVIVNIRSLSTLELLSKSKIFHKNENEEKNDRRKKEKRNYRQQGKRKEKKMTVFPCPTMFCLRKRAPLRLIISLYCSPKEPRQNWSSRFLFMLMQQTQSQGWLGHRSSTSSHSSLKATTTTTLLNGLLPSHRFSQTSAHASNLSANLSAAQLQALQKYNRRLKRTQCIKRTGIIMSLTVSLSLLLTITVESAAKLIRIEPIDEISSKSLNSSSNLTIDSNDTNSQRERNHPIHGFFICIWIYNSLLLIACLIVHSVAIQRRSKPGRTQMAILR